MVAGGTGSFGETITKISLNLGIKEVRIFSRDEKKQEDMRRAIIDKRLNFIIGDVRDKSRVKSAVSGVDFLFQAAALKQVPSCEFYPMEAVKTNILGTSNILEAASESNVKKIVVLSTDKAVYPINAMGISKAMMEKVAIAKARELKNKSINTKIFITRYGNVMCSRGSLIPFIINKIKKNEDLTITDPEMTRFMMSLEDSTNLVLKAFNDGITGDIFVQKSPSASVKNIVLAIKKIFDSKSEIIYLGPRHGEKKHETLCSAEELGLAKNLGKYYRIPADLRNINYDLHIRKNNKYLSSIRPYDSKSTKRLNLKQVTDLISKQPYVVQQLKLH